MKKILIASVVALTLTTAHQKAHAWSKYNFGVGMNVGWEGGGNTVLWGLFKGQNVPGAPDVGTQGGGFPGQKSGGFPGNYGYDPYQFNPAMSPVPGGEPPLAPTNLEKVAPPTPLKPAAYNSYQPGTGYYPGYANSPMVPQYPGYTGYPDYTNQTNYPMYPAYYGR